MPQKKPLRIIPKEKIPRKEGKWNPGIANPIPSPKLRPSQLKEGKIKNPY